MVAGIPLARLAHKSLLASFSSGLPLALAFLVVGLIVSTRKPQHPIGWIMLGVAVLFPLNDVASTYSVLDYRDHRGLPLGPLAVLLQPAWAPAIVLFGIAVLLFPDGRLPSRRLRWLLWTFLAVGAWWMVGAYAIAAAAILTHTIRVTPTGDLYQMDHPTGAAVVWWRTQDVFFPLLAVCLVVWIVAQVPIYRRASPDLRRQLKWLVGGVSIAAVAGVLTFTLQGTVGSAAIVGVAALPVAIGVGILKYRLYEIDRLVSRTLSYAIVTGLLAALFIGLVVLTTDVLPFSSPVGVAASTLAAAALFNPLRVRVQGLVDRRFNRARYDAEATVAAHGQRLREAVDLESVQSGLLEAVTAAFEPAHVSVWLRGAE